jgi:hypothetical protein
MKRKLYLIDGVAVPRKVYWRRQKYGEYIGATFLVIEVMTTGKKGA